MAFSYSPKVELMRKRILADYERDVSSGEVRLHPGKKHPKVRGTERLGFAKLDLYPNAKPKSVKPIRLVGERAAAGQDIVEDFLARGWRSVRKQAQVCHGFMKAPFPSDKRCSHTAPHNEVGKELFGNKHKECDTVHLPFSEKQKGKWRLVVDYRQLNEATLPDAHTLPRNPNTRFSLFWT